MPEFNHQHCADSLMDLGRAVFTLSLCDGIHDCSVTPNLHSRWLRQRRREIKRGEESAAAERRAMRLRYYEGMRGSEARRLCVWSNLLECRSDAVHVIEVERLSTILCVDGAKGGGESPGGIDPVLSNSVLTAPAETRGVRWNRVIRLHWQDSCRTAPEYNG